MKTNGSGLGYVYFAGSLSLGMVKIGYSGESPDGRIKTHQVGSPVILDRLGFVRGGRDVESSLHEQFDRDHSHGEWFYLSKDLREWIKANCDPWEEPAGRKQRDRAMERVVRESSGNPQLSPQALAARKARYERQDREDVFAMEMVRDFTIRAEMRRETAAGKTSDSKPPEPA